MIAHSKTWLDSVGVVQQGSQAAARLVGYLGDSNRRYEFSDALLHCPIHLGNNARYAVLFNYFDVVNGITPDRIAGFEIRNLGGHGNFYSNAAAVIQFFQLLQTPTKNVVSIGTAVIQPDTTEGAAGT